MPDRKVNAGEKPDGDVVEVRLLTSLFEKAEKPGSVETSTNQPFPELVQLKFTVPSTPVPKVSVLPQASKSISRIPTPLKTTKKPVMPVNIQKNTQNPFQNISRFFGLA